jgi:hypothetical protein
MATFNANYKPVKGDTPEDIVRKKYSLHIVPGNPKIGARTANVSLKSGPPKAGGTCMNCANCVKKCYDLKADRAYPEVLTARLENAHLAIHELDLFERAMIEYLSRKKNLQFFRWHVGGDIPSLAYLHMMARIAQSFPHVRFLVFTKHWREKDGLSLETFARPKNLAMLLSCWESSPIRPPQIEGMYHAYTADMGGGRPYGVKKSSHAPGSVKIATFAGTPTPTSCSKSTRPTLHLKTRWARLSAGLRA